MEQILEAIHCVSYLKRFEIREYSKAFREYMETCGDAVEKEICAAEASGGTEGLNALAADVLNELERRWKAQRFWNRAAAKADSKQMILVYLSPMLLEKGGACALFAQLLRDGWAARWPKDAYAIADYQKLRKGFRNVILGVDLDRLRRTDDDEE